MSFDIHFQGFIAGSSGKGGGHHMREVLGPYTVDRQPEFSFLKVEIGDGSADVYLHEDGMMASRIKGNASLDLLVRGAKAANWVIIPVGCSVCLTAPEQRKQLPQDLLDDVVLIESGVDLLAVINAG